MKACKCGSYAINHHCHGRDGTDSDLCDVCYWRKRAEQPAPQEPVAIHQFRSPHCSDWYDGVPDHHDGHGPYEVRTFYASPPAQRTWVGLTDEEITDIWAESSPYYHEDDFARAIEAKLKEKNTP